MAAFRGPIALYVILILFVILMAASSSALAETFAILPLLVGVGWLATPILGRSIASNQGVAQTSHWMSGFIATSWIECCRRVFPIANRVGRGVNSTREWKSVGSERQSLAPQFSSTEFSPARRESVLAWKSGTAAVGIEFFTFSPLKCHNASLSTQNSAERHCGLRGVCQIVRGVGGRPFG